MPKSHGYRTSTRRSLSTQVLLLQAYRWVSIVVRYLPLQKRPVSPSSPQSRAKNLLEKILPHRPTVTSDSHSHFSRFPPLPLCYSCIFHLTTHHLYFVFPSFYGHSTILFSSDSRARGCEGGVVFLSSWDGIWSTNDTGVWSATLRVA